LSVVVATAAWKAVRRSTLSAAVHDMLCYAVKVEEHTVLR
jgi:hypothetical protein